MKPHHHHIICLPSGEPLPHSFAVHRNRAIKRFLGDPEFGYGGKWRNWSRKGYRVARCTIEISTK